MKDCMIDIETLGTSPRAPIISIGARMFDRQTWELGDSFYMKAAPDLSRYSADFSTIQWWLGQSEAARAEFANSGLSLHFALTGLTYAIAKKWKPQAVWAMPPTFDVVILENAFRTEGVAVPWAYDASRCVRTVCDLAKLPKEERAKAVVEHNALADCDAQILTLKAAFARIGSSFGAAVAAKP